MSTEQKAGTKLANREDHRNRDIIQEYLSNGHSTLDSIGTQHGLTRERVRQIVVKGVGGELSPEDISQMRKRDTLRRNVQKVEHMVFEEGSTVNTVAAVVSALGVSASYLTENREAFAEALEEVSRRRTEKLLTLPRQAQKSFTDEDIYTAVRRVSALMEGKPLTTPAYDLLRLKTEPSVSLIQIRMGGIINACKGAGVTHGEPRQKRSIYNEEKIVAAIVKCVEDLGLESVRLLSFANYSDWATKGNGPSGSRVRQIFGNWNNAKMAVDEVS